MDYSNLCGYNYTAKFYNNINNNCINNTFIEKKKKQGEE